MKNQVQLITYVDRLGGGAIRDLGRLLGGPLQGVFGAVHLLPFFDPIDGADAGFDPIDHTRVDRRLGDWSDIEALSQQLDVMADVIVNHMSDRSAQFQDFLQRGGGSDYDGLFLTRDAVFAHGASESDLARIYRPRPGSPFREVILGNGERRTLWTTFTPHQVDIDVTHPQGSAYLQRILSTLAANGVRLVRLDAVGYAIKKAGTSCFMLPETFGFISEFALRARDLGIEVLVEVHSYYQRQIEIARHVDWVYDFALPPLVLHAFMAGDAQYLKRWIRIRPTECAYRAGYARWHRHYRHRRRRERPQCATGSGAAGADRQIGGVDSREQRRPEPQGHRRGGLQSGSVSGELHVLRRSGG